MSRYASRPPQSDWDPERPLHLSSPVPTVMGVDRTPIPTGLLNVNGWPIFRLPPPFGFRHNAD